MRITLFTLAIITSISLNAQQLLKIDDSETRLYSFLTIESGHLIDLRTNKYIILTSGAWGESKWYKQNDSVFLIDFYIHSIPMIRNQPTLKYKLEIYRDSFSFIRRKKKYAGYPILNKDQLNEIKAKQAKPCESELFQNKSKKTSTQSHLDEVENYLAFIEWTAVAIINGHDEFIEIYNSLKDKNCCGAQCNEAYYETQYGISLFELETYTIKYGRELLPKKG